MSEIRSDLPLKPSNSQYTDGQWQAIYDHGANILVSASAGSGKTTVLVQRVIEKIKGGTNVDQLLIVTYTEAAAKEMKQRIKQAVEQSISAESDGELKRHFMHQLSLIPTANVSTLHAFCLQVIRKYYYLIQIDPVFRLLTDETEMILLKEDVWEELREELYEKDQEEFYRLTANFSNDRSDDGLTRLIFSLYEFARSNPNPKAWLDSLGTAYEVRDSLADAGIYQEVLKPNLIKELDLIISQSQEMVALAEGQEKFSKVSELLAGEVTVGQSLLDLLQGDDLEGVYRYLMTLSFGRYPSLRNLEDEEKATNELIKELRNSNKKMLTDWQKGLFSIEPEKMVAVMKESQVMVSQMAEVAFRFERAYSARKAEKNLVDFNDLEHFTLQILATITADGWQGTEASTYYREKFVEVLVDEYQDINQLQENILLWLRQPKPEKGNLFMVGDVKQSIYSFRLADPTLFIDKYNRFGEGQDGRRIILAENFRSRRNVLDFTNLIFEQLMNTSVGQLEYDEAAQLINGFKGFPETNHYDTEILIFENTNETEDEFEDVDDSFQIDDKTEGELRLVGNKIKGLIAEKFPIYDKKTKETRPIRYQDIVLLTPTKKNNLVLLDIFKELAIPLHVNDTQNYFQATEIRIMIALLNVIDNPYQDIPLAAVLRSPIVGLKENQLAEIRASLTTGSFFDAFTHVVRNDSSELGRKLTVFNSQLLNWREMARRQPLVELIWQIYQDTGFLDYVGGMPAGAQRQANLHALYERATSYEEMSFKGLFQFVRFIEKMQGKDKDLAEPTAISEDEDAVRVMTIHASKGLEFPVVFVLDLTRRFNLMDLNNAYIFDDKLGAGIKYTDQDSRLFYRTLPFLAIREEKRKKLLSEEMRKLYVALTRAEEKLFLVGSYKDQEAAWKKWSRSAMEPRVVLGDELRLKSLTLMDWIGLTLMRHQDAQKFQTEYEVVKVGGVYQHPAHFKISFSGLEALRPDVTAVEEVNESAPVFVTENPRVLTDALARLDFVYPFKLSTKTTSYQSVSEIKRVFEDPDNADLLTLDLTQEKAQTVNRYADDQLAKPKFMENIGGVQGTEVGTATHLIMQLMPLEMPTEASLDQLITELVTNRSLDQRVAEKIDRQAIIAFYQSDFGQLLLSNSQGVTREQPFSMLMQAEAIFKDYPAAAEDKILIHGIIDGYYEDSDQLILYDFKTDHMAKVDQVNLEKVKQKYRGQLSLYQQALEQVKGRSVTGVKLILLSAGQYLEMVVE
nr:helicase-exonuclease AddAB subunit AddA [Vagococcus allomyrinae]